MSKDASVLKPLAQKALFPIPSPLQVTVGRGLSPSDHFGSGNISFADATLLSATEVL